MLFSIDSFLTTQHDANPLDLPILAYLPLLALAAIASKVLPSAPSLIPPFVSNNEAAQVSQRRAKTTAQTAGEPRYADTEFKTQQTRIRWLLALALLQMLAWSIYTGVELSWLKGLPVALTWLGILLSIVTSPPQTPPFAILVALSILLVSSLCDGLRYLPAIASSSSIDWSPAFFHSLDLIVIASQIAIILAMPVVPGGWEATVDEAERSRLREGMVVEESQDMAANYNLCPTTPEDYTSLGSTLSYSWMSPIQQLALKRPLVPMDLWRLRSINDTRLLFSKFRASSHRPDGQRRGLASRLIKANARDVSLDAAYKVVGVTLAYASPALMRGILEAIGKAKEDLDSSRDTPGQWTPRERAFVLALAALLLTLVRYVAELLNFHHARQVGLRVRSVMVAELFEKALKRRSVAGAPSTAAAGEKKKEVSFSLREKAAKAFKKNKKVELNMEADQRQGGAETNELAEQEAGEETKDVAVPPTQPPSSSSADVGKVVNMMSSDVNVLLRMGCDLHQLYGAPAEVIIATIFLCRLLGWSALAGFSVLLFATPLSYFQGKASVRAQRDWKGKVDTRMGLVTELLGAARFVKLQGAAAQWKERVLNARAAEISALFRVRYAELGFTVIYSALPIGVSLFAFFCYVKIQGNELDVPTAFTAVTLFSMVRAPLNTIPFFAMATLNAFVSIRRLEAFLEEEEVDEIVSAFSSRSNSGGHEDLAPHKADTFTMTTSQEPLEILDGTFSWNALPSGSSSPLQPTLREINVSFPPGVLSVVAGPTGSGKSSLLHALLGELRQTAGVLHLPKWNGDDRQLCGLSYAAQSPWIEGGKTFKQNILFNNVYDEQRYNEVLYACALLDDLALFEDGDQTQVSSTTLSGGQQARLSLARALYAPSHCVLLDDPLAAVDSHVQRHLILHALTGSIAQGRRIILVTHHAGLVMSRAAYVVSLRDGKVILQGSVKALSARGQLTGPLAIKKLPEGSKASSSQERSAEEVTDQKTALQPTQNGDGSHAQEGSKSRLLYQLEGRRTGAVQFSYYSVYLGASSSFLWAIIIMLVLSLRVVASGEQYWLKVWGEASGSSSQRTGLIAKLPPAQGHEGFYLAVYGFIGLSLVVFRVVQTMIFWLATLQASQKLYSRLLTSVLSAKLRFFDTNPLGRILQRFNQDVSVMDSDLPSSSVNFLNNSLAMFGYLVICAIIVPWFLLPAAIFLAFLPGYVKGFLACTRDMQRIESTSTSPLYTTFASAMAGITTIRAFGMERVQLDQMMSILDVTQAQWWAICTIEVWLSFRSQILGGIAVFLVSTLALLGAVSPGSAGMVMTSAQLITQLGYYLTTDWKHLSNNLNSIERIVEYFDLPPESSSSKGKLPPAAWPGLGSIHIEDLVLSYDESLPDVLHGVSLDIGPCEKVGVVGRTGSGKTTLASALFRSMEAKSGRILIDGIDIAQLDVDELRRRISIVPQSPVLFSGTVRSNLDPWSEKTDEEVEWALKQVRVEVKREEAITTDDDEEDGPAMTLTLDTVVAAGGANFSAGEAQLLSLARALLRDARVVVLDEATSSTDAETDNAIQRAVRAMKDSIVLTVAHRLQTVLDYDEVVVLSQGRILEKGPPWELFQKQDGEFKKMCLTSGITEVAKP